MTVVLHVVIQCKHVGPAGGRRLSHGPPAACTIHLQCTYTSLSYINAAWASCMFSVNRQ